jgi:hypothetical protein
VSARGTVKESMKTPKMAIALATAACAIRAGALT